MESFRIQIASDVSARDGLAVELVATSGKRVAEVFRDDDDEGKLAFNSFGEITVPFDVFIKFIRSAESEFVSD